MHGWCPVCPREWLLLLYGIESEIDPEGLRRSQDSSLNGVRFAVWLQSMLNWSGRSELVGPMREIAQRRARQKEILRGRWPVVESLFWRKTMRWSGEQNASFSLDWDCSGRDAGNLSEINLLVEALKSRGGESAATLYYGERATVTRNVPVDSMLSLLHALLGLRND